VARLPGITGIAWSLQAGISQAFFAALRLNGAVLTAYQVRETGMKKGVPSMVALALIFCLFGCEAFAQPAPSPSHDKSFWHAIAANKYQIPPDEQPFALAQELSAYFGSPDPELRDDLAYSILTVWIVNQRQFSPEELVKLEEEWTANLRSGIGENGTDSVFKRSFSALCLSSLAERELKAPFFGEPRYRKLLDSAIAYLSDEKDLRGFDATKGWIHATAHTADLLAALGENPLFTKRDQASVLKAVATRLATADVVFTYGEQDRLANVVAIIATRPNFDMDVFREWLEQMDAADRGVWKDSPPKSPGLTRFQNDSYMLRALVTQLLQQPSTATSLDAQKLVLKSLQRR